MDFLFLPRTWAFIHIYYFLYLKYERSLSHLLLQFQCSEQYLHIIATQRKRVDTWMENRERSSFNGLFIIVCFYSPREQRVPSWAAPDLLSAFCTGDVSPPSFMQLSGKFPNQSFKGMDGFWALSPFFSCWVSYVHPISQNKRPE